MFSGVTSLFIAVSRGLAGSREAGKEMSLEAEPSQTFLNGCGSEIDQQGDGETCEREVSECLGLMNPKELLDGLDLDDDLALDDQINAVGLLELDALVGDG
jgi:hypothetical protein